MPRNLKKLNDLGKINVYAQVVSNLFRDLQGCATLKITEIARNVNIFKTFYIVLADYILLCSKIFA